MTTRFAKLLILALGTLAAAQFVPAVESSPGVVLEFQREQAAAARGRFPHEKKEHQKLDCASCHLGAKEKPRRTDQPMARDFPHSSCVRCHNFAAEFFKVAFGKPSGFCATCHESRHISKSDKALIPGVLTRGEQSDFGDVFSHKAHRKSLPADLRILPTSTYGSQFTAGSVARCTDCHIPIQREPINRMDMKTEKAHASCFVCHGGNPPEPRRVTAREFPYEQDCAACHALRTGAPAGVQVASLFGRIRDFRHNDHDLDIRPKRRSDFPLPTALDYMCAACHEPISATETLADIRMPAASYCDRCHIDNRPGLPSALESEVRTRLR
jgi:hypothetical protein